VPNDGIAAQRIQQISDEDDMRLRLSFILFLAIGVAGWGDARLPWPHAGPMPDAPVSVPPSTYVPLSIGTKSYHPVEPMPWGDVNKRVAPMPEGSGKPGMEMHKGHEMH
jgi:hypothetical protein